VEGSVARCGLAAGENQPSDHRGRGTLESSFIKEEVNGVIPRRLPVHLDIRVDEVIERPHCRSRHDGNIAPRGNHHAMRVHCSEKVVSPAWILPSLPCIDRDPAKAVHIKFCPAVVTGQSTFMSFREQEPDLEPRRDSCGSGHGNEQGVEIGTIATAPLKCPKSVTSAGSTALLIVVHC
jgi:hypothetical protein